MKFKTLEQELKALQTFKQQLKYLQEYYPCLAILVSHSIERPDMAKKFILGSRIYYNGDGGLYSWYVHAFWLPWLSEQRDLGKLKKGGFS